MAAGTLKDEKALIHRLRELNMRAQRLNDQQEVENLQHIYGYYVDRKMWDDVSDLFSDDGIMEMGLQGIYTGKKSIRHALDQFGSQDLREGELNDHLQLQTLVHISPDGLTAKARGSELIMSGKYGEAGEWGLSVFENEYMKREGIWYIKAMHLYPIMRADYDRGWAKGTRPAPEFNKEFPPDKQTAESYELFPKYYIPMFHYKNPVTGLPPKYPEGVRLAGQASFTYSIETADVGQNEKTASINEPEKMAEETERLLRRAIGYDAAENINSAYGYYIDDFSWDETADLFAIDGWKELSNVGVYVGRERVRESLKVRYPGGGGRKTGYFAGHQLTQPVIHVSDDGRSANVRVRLFQLGGASEVNGLWIGGIYENKAAMENGIWKIKQMDLDYVWTADYKGGWAHSAGRSKPQQDKTMIEKFPPDRPLRGVITAPFPEIMDMPFHYVNPVSGREPGLLLR